MALLVPNGTHFPREDLQNCALQMLSKTGCSLNTVNNYRENVIHLCASSNCAKTIELILRRHGTEKADSKNKFGWTPLMQALRERHLETAQLLINSGFHPSHRSYLGMSTLGIATAAGQEAFECIFARYPVAINCTATDDVSPLCVAATKDDRSLVLRILQLGVSLQTASEYTHYMMRHSVHEDIRKMAKSRLSVEDYWENDNDNIQVKSNVSVSEDEMNNNECAKSNPEIAIHAPEDLETPKQVDGRVRNPHHLTINVVSQSDSNRDNMLSPNLTYNQTGSYCMSPNVCFKLDTNNIPMKRKNEQNPDDGASLAKRANRNDTPSQFRYDNNNRGINRCSPDSTTGNLIVKPTNDVPTINISENYCDEVSSTTDAPPNKCAKVRPPNLQLKDENDAVDLNMSLGFIPDFKPAKSPNAPHSDDDEDAYGSKTPTPPRCSTPPTGIVLTNSQNQLVRLLHAHGLDRHVAIFIEQEVDFELFSTLREADLIDIGIENDAERKELLKLI